MLYVIWFYTLSYKRRAPWSIVCAKSLIIWAWKIKENVKEIRLEIGLLKGLGT